MANPTAARRSWPRGSVTAAGLERTTSCCHLHAHLRLRSYCYNQPLGRAVLEGRKLPVLTTMIKGDPLSGETEGRRGTQLLPL